nr:uncharacterized TPR repeat-containing protein At1g05150-like [Ipomoea batatas]
MSTRGSRSEKVKRIFQQFDVNRDGGLNREEMAALVVAVNPRVKFSDEQINAILDEVFRTYGEFIDGEKGLTFDGLLRTYDDGAGDVDRDFDALGLELKPENDNGISMASEGASSSIADERVMEPHKKQRTAAWAASPNHGIVFDDTWKLVDDLEILIKRLKAKQSKDGKLKNDNSDVYSDPGWSRGKLGPSSELSDKRVVWDESGHDYAVFCQRIGRFESAAEAGGNQWAYLLPQIHVNLGIALEGEGMVISACEHYREAAILCPTHFRALKLLGSALFGVGEYKAAVKALEEAIYMKNDYADAHCDLASALHAMGDDDNAIKEFQRAIDLKPGHIDALYNLGGLYMDMQSTLETASEKTVEGNGSGNAEEAFVIVEPSKFKTVGEKTTLRPELATALDIRVFQRITRLKRCDVETLKKEMNETDVPVSYSGSGAPEKSIRKASLEEILRKLLGFLKPETFVEAVKAINQKILSVLDDSESGRVDLGMFLALLAPLCGGTPDKRKRIVYDALLWRPVNEGGTQIRKTDAQRYIKLLRAIYIPSHGASELLEIHGEVDTSLVSFQEFLVMFDDPDWGFGIMNTLLKLEVGDRNRHGSHCCATCRYPIIGSRFKEMKSHISLCSQCYSEGKVPPTCKQDEYKFKEYASESDAVKDKCMWFGISKSSSPTATTTTS